MRRLRSPRDRPEQLDGLFQEEMKIDLDPPGGMKMEIPENTTQECANCGNGGQTNVAGATPSYIYALGQIESRFPTLAIEKEFAQATARTGTKGKTDRQAFHAVLSQSENRYLARELCWVFSIQGTDTYILRPHESGDLDLLIKVVGPQPDPWLNAVIGVRGPVAPPEHCNGLMVPIVVFDQIYSFDRPTLIKAIPKPEKIAAEAFEPAAEELLDRVLLMTDNAGAADEHRALNYLAMRYPAIYGKAAESFANDCSLTGVDTNYSTLSSTRKLVDVIFSFTHRATDFTEKFYARVDVTEEYPFLVTKLSPYYDR
jgi:hypothetical protein